MWGVLVAKADWTLTIYISKQRQVLWITHSLENFLDEPFFLLLLVFWLMWFFVTFLTNQNKEYAEELPQTRGILKSKRQLFVVHSFQALPMDPWKGALGFRMTESLACQSLSIGTWTKKPLRKLLGENLRELLGSASLSSLCTFFICGEHRWAAGVRRAFFMLRLSNQMKPCWSRLATQLCGC